MVIGSRGKNLDKIEQATGLKLKLVEVQSVLEYLEEQFPIEEFDDYELQYESCYMDDDD